MAVSRLFKLLGGQWVALDGGSILIPPPPPPPPPSGLTMSFGMENDMPGASISSFGNDYTSFNTTAPLMGGRSRINCARIFSGSMVGAWPAFAKAYTDGGAIAMFSMVNQDYAGILAGNYNTTLDNLVNSMPDNQILIMNHEPENPNKVWAADPAGRFVPTQVWLYDRVKAINPTIKVIQSHMAYQWAPGRPSTPNPSAWIVPANKTDGYGCDAYHFSWAGATLANVGNISLDATSGFPRWFATFKGLGKPLGFCEFAIQSAPTNADPTIPDNVRAKWITDSLAYLKSTNLIDFVMYWNGDNNADGDDAITPPSVWPLSNAAWVDFVTANGKTNYSVDQFLGNTP